MKKKLLIISMVCTLGLVGCGQSESISCPATTGTPTVTGESTSADSTLIHTGENSEGNIILTKPPKLSVLHGESAIEALQGSYSWCAQNGDGTFSNSEVRCGHPLKAKQSMPSLSLTPSYLSHVEPFTVYLQFDVAPDSVQVISWNESCWGLPDFNTESENITVTSSKDTQTNGTGYRQYQFELKEGNYIYSISAKWDSSELYNGSVEYSFYTVYPLLEAMPIETEGEKQNVSPYTFPANYDFNHNGTAEVLTLTSGDTETLTDATYWTLSLTENGQTIWSFTAATAHAGWGSIFAVEAEDKDYLMYYSPYMNQGMAGYSYYIFSLDTQNKEVRKQENSVSFDINFRSPLHESFDPTAIAAFMQEADALLEKSSLLFSTEGGTLQFDGKGTDFREDEAWLESEYDSSKSLEENLRLYEQKHSN